MLKSDSMDDEAGDGERSVAVALFATVAVTIFGSSCRTGCSRPGLERCAFVTEMAVVTDYSRLKSRFRRFIAVNSCGSVRSG